MSSPQSAASTQLLLDLEKRRSVIEKLLSIARSMESLKGSLEGLMLHNQATDQIPDVIFAFIGSLGKKIKNLSDAEIAMRLATLEKKANFKFDDIRMLLEQINNDTAEVPLFDVSETLLEDFRRQTQTSLALRCLLKKRGVKVEERSLPISGSELKDKLKKLNLKESAIRENAVQQIQALIHDIDQAMSGEHGQATQKMMADIKQGLLDNLAHIKAGKSLFELPTPMETIELTDARLDSYEYQLLPADNQADAPGEQTAAVADSHQDSGKQDQTGMANETKPQSTSLSPRQDTQASSAVNERPKGVWQRFVFWLNTPWKVKWKHTKK